MDTDAYTPSPDHVHGLETLAYALESGRLQSATSTVQRLMEQTLDPEKLGEDLAHTIEEAYDNFHIAPLIGFASWLKMHPAQDIAERAVEPVRQALEDLEHWRKTLSELARERLGRSLRMLIRSRKGDESLSAARRMLRDAKTPEQRLVRCRQMGTLLGSLGQDRDRADKIVKAIGKNLVEFGLEQEHFRELCEYLDKTRTSLTAVEMAQHETQWTLVETETIVELMRKLPGRGATHVRPRPEDEKRFYDTLHVMLAAHFHDAPGLEPQEAADRFMDVSRLLREFAPTAREAATIEGVEEVAFLRMSGLDRLVAVRSLRRLGTNRTLVSAVCEAARQHPAGKPHEILLYLMGALANPAFYEPLVAALRDSKLSRMHDTIIESLGRIGDERCLAMLEKVLASCCHARVIDPPVRRRIGNCLAAIGAIARHPDTTPSQRSAIVLETFKTLPDDRHLGRLCLQHFCKWNPATLSDEVKRIVVQQIVDNLWTLDTKSKLAKGDPNQKTELGFREEVVEIAVEMGASILPILLAAADRRALQYSGAYMGMAEILSKIGNDSARIFLQKILTATLRTDESAIPEHLRESYYDAAQDRMVPLSRDKIAHSIVFAIHKACADGGLDLLDRFAQRIKAGEFESPGSETMDLLAKLLVGSGDNSRRRIPALDSTAPPGAKRDPSVREMDFEPFVQSDTESSASGYASTKRPRQDEPLSTLLKEIRGKGLFGVKLEKRISAIQEVGSRKEIEAIKALSEQLLAKEKVVAAAAETALTEIVNPRSSPKMFRVALFELLESMRGVRGSELKAVSAMIDRMRPERDPVKSLLMRFIEMESEERLRKDVIDLFRIANERLERSGKSMDLTGAIGSGGLAAPKQQDGQKPVGKPATAQDVFALKREYFAARQAWVAGGKQGPEPPRPRGI